MTIDWDWVQYGFVDLQHNAWAAVAESVNRSGVPIYPDVTLGFNLNQTGNLIRDLTLYMIEVGVDDVYLY